MVYCDCAASGRLTAATQNGSGQQLTVKLDFISVDVLPVSPPIGAISWERKAFREPAVEWLQKPHGAKTKHLSL